jgi:aminoglycoside phosphotransferase (APT) family kinase protein
VLVLTLDNAARWLVGRGLATPADIVDGRLAITDAARRNRNFRVTRARPACGYLVKQSAEAGADRGVDAEAAFYRFCDRHPAGEPVRAWLPRFVDYAESTSTLVIELLEEATPIWSFWADSDAPADRAATAGALGEALASLHTALRLESIGAPPLSLASDCPWILWVHRPRPTFLERVSAANVQAIKILQANPRVTRALDALRQQWSAPTVIHNDIKSDNVLVCRAADGRCDVRLIDWELVQAGDPAWDVGGVFCDVWVHRVASVPLDLGKTAEQALEESQHRLSTSFPVVRAFWAAYRKRAMPDKAEWPVVLDRSVRFAAARLIQSAYEIAQDAPVLPNPSVVMLQLAANVLEDPDSAQLHLLGIPPSLALPAVARS